MTLSRRSFLKVAGLTVVAAASASMFTGCGVTSTTPIKLVADTSSDEADEAFKNQVTAVGKKKLVVWPGDAKDDYLKGYLPSYLSKNGLKNFEIVKYEYKTEKDKNNKDYKYLEVTVKAAK